MLSPIEEYALPNEAARRVIESYLKDDDAFVDELYLATSYEPVLEIEEEDRDYIRGLMSYWRKGYALPITALREIRRINTGSPSIEDLEENFLLTLLGEEIAVEPDVNLEFAREFLSHIHADKILDIASGFGWIPPLFSNRGRVLALDNSYSNRIVFEDDRIRIEGTSIELFPDWREAREYVLNRREEFREYKDFAQLFWRFQGASLDNITILQGDAADMKNCHDLSHNREFFIEDNSMKWITCFFGLNHIGKAWKDVLRESYRVLMPKGKALIAIYKEHLEKFPLKFAYDWTEQLEIEIIKLEEFRELSEEIGFKMELTEEYNGKDLFLSLIHI